MQTSDGFDLLEYLDSLLARDPALAALLPYLAGLQTGLSSYFTLSGAITDPGIYDQQILQAGAPSTTETATYTAAGVPVTDTYMGPTLWNLLQSAGGVTTTSAKNDILSKYVIATGSDGYAAVFSLGEIDPSFGDQPILVAYADTAGQLGPSGADGFARMVVPSDQAGGRYVSNLVSLQVGSLPPSVPGPGGISDQLAVSGHVADPGTFTPVTLEALNQGVTETATYLSSTGRVTDTYTGVPLWTLLNDTGVLTDPSVKNDILRDFVVATGSDGYRAIISLGEIDPAFGNQPDLVAYADTAGQLGPSGPDGAMRLIVPGDQAGGRYVSNLVSLTVVHAT